MKLMPLPSGARAEIAIGATGSAKPLIRKRVDLSTSGDITEATVRVGNLPPGEYNVSVQAKAADGKPIGRKSVTPFVWPVRPVVSMAGVTQEGLP